MVTPQLGDPHHGQHGAAPYHLGPLAAQIPELDTPRGDSPGWHGASGKRALTQASATTSRKRATARKKAKGARKNSADLPKVQAEDLAELEGLGMRYNEDGTVAGKTIDLLEQSAQCLHDCPETRCVLTLSARFMLLCSLS
jgi:hypothetical protein